MGTDAYVGEISMFAGDFAPKGWALCDGQILEISQNTALFSLLGTHYGGDGRTTFGLPDLRGRVPMHKGMGPGLSSRDLGQQPGQEAVALAAAEMPQHSHSFNVANAPADSDRSSGRILGRSSIYVKPDENSPAIEPLHEATIAPSGASMPHDNIQPSLCINFIIALTGVFPSRD